MHLPGALTTEMTTSAAAAATSGAFYLRPALFADDIYHFAAINYAKFDDVLFLIDNLVFASIIIVNFRSHNEEVVP